MTRKIDDGKYLKYLFQSLGVKELKEVCKDYNLRGYSKLKKIELIDFIKDSLSTEEISDLIKKKELDIISEEIDLAIKKINGEERETIQNIKNVNPKTHELELNFKGFNWETESYISITDKNIEDPGRDCDCRTGANLGFCSHFWVGFIYSLKEGYFKLEDWELTPLPADFEKRVKEIKIEVKESEKEEGEEAVTLINYGSDDAILMKMNGESVTIYEGEIKNLEKKESEFQGNITIYYLITLENVKVGPRVKKKDFKQEDVELVEKLMVRVSERLQEDKGLQIGDKINFNGRLDKDNFLRAFIVKNVRKIDKI